MTTKRDYEQFKPGQCMEDCIHLHACRRVQKIGRSKHLLVPRYCDEYCEAYEPEGDIERAVSIEAALDYARSNAYLIRSGYDEYDVFLPGELEMYSFLCRRCN